jgi:hypothetical protein
MHPGKMGTLTLFALLAAGAGAQTEARLNRRVDLVLEKKEGTAIRAMDPGHVFAEGDWIRFRLRPGVDGFLHVINQGSSGRFEQLFPRPGEQQSKFVKAGKEYVIPDSDKGWFRIQGPAGYETVYFLVSPKKMEQALPDSAADTKAFATATPRCDDEVFRARGECLDDTAGLKPTSRDLVVVKDSNDISVSSTEPFESPLVYRFRIAHK